MFMTPSYVNIDLLNNNIINNIILIVFKDEKIEHILVNINIIRTLINNFV